MLFLSEKYTWKLRQMEFEQNTLSKNTYKQQTFYLFIYLFTSFSGHRPAQRECAQSGLWSHVRCHPYPIPQCVKVGHTTKVYDPYSFQIVMWVLLRPTRTNHWNYCETGPKVFHPYPRRLESLIICRCHYKGSTFFSVIKDPECWSSRGMNLRPPTWQTGALPTKLTRRQFNCMTICFNACQTSNVRQQNTSCLAPCFLVLCPCLGATYGKFCFPWSKFTPITQILVLATRHKCHSLSFSCPAIGKTPICTPLYTEVLKYQWTTNIKVANWRFNWPW